MEDKSGDSSFGKGRFYSSCHQKVIPSVCFFALSLIDVSTGSSFLLYILQVFHTEEEMKTNAVLYYPMLPPAKRKAGRPAVYGQKVDLNKRVL